MIKFNGERFRQVAADHGDKTLDDISARTGLDPAVLSRMIRGERTPQLPTITRAADAYGTPIDDLILRDPNPEPTEETAA